MQRSLYFKLFTQSVTFSFVMLWSKHSPSCQVPVPAMAARLRPLAPKGDEWEVAKGMTVLPEKSLCFTKSSTGQAALPYQIG